MDLYAKWSVSETVKAVVMLEPDDADTADGLIEEAYVTISPADKPVDFTFGRKELKFGQDKKLWENEPLLHGWAEDDNELVMQFGFQAGEKAKIYLTNWQDQSGVYTNASGDEEPDDNFLFQSYAIKGEIDLVEGLDLNVSYLNRHDDSQIGAGQSTDEGRVSIGVAYKNKDVGVEAFFEYLSLTDTNFTDGRDGSVLGIGTKFALGMDKKFEVGLLYELEDIEDSAGVTVVDESAFVLGCAYKLDSKTKAILEYVIGSDDLNNVDATRLTAGIQAKF
ncbi:MAG: porin [Planctomycetota bacterium]|jgi:predicted porin